MLPSNRMTWRVYQSAWWLFSSNGMGDATFPGEFAQTTLGDLGITGPARVDVMERLRVLDDERKALDRIDDGEHKGESIRAARAARKKRDQETPSN